MNRLALLCVFFTFLFAWDAPAQSIQPVLLTDNTEVVPLLGRVQTAWASKDLPFQEVGELPFSSTFTSHFSDGSVLWMRFEVQNLGQSNTRWILRSERFLSYHSVELHTPSKQAQRFHEEMYLAERPVQDVQPAFYVDLSDPRGTRIYLRIEPNIGWDFLSDPSDEFRFITEKAWISARFHRFIGQSAFFTFLVVTILYQLLTVLIEVDRSRLWYISLLFSYIVYFAFLSNFCAEFFAPYLTEALFAPLGVVWLVLSYAGFISSFLDLRTTYPRLRITLFMIAILNGLNSLVAVLQNVFAVPLSPVIVPLTNICTGAVIVLALLVTFQRIREGYKPARLFLLASGMLALSALSVAFVFLGIFPGLGWGASIFQMGAVAECLILSVAVTNRLRFIRKDKEQSLAMLEQRVQEVLNLKTELDHQLASRSRELTQALATSWTSPSEQRLNVGDIFEGRYRVLAPLGKGGMGVVFTVERISDQKKVALKILRGATTRLDAARFTREAEISARMNHPNLVKLFDVGLASGSPFIVMELVEGGSLEEQRQKFGDVLWAIPLLAGIARGLAGLHQSNIVHRDLKPSNVLLNKDGIPKIADFGISRYDDAPTIPEPSEPTSGTATTLGAGQAAQKTPELTVAGAILGTPRYMPPEASEGARSASPAWDIFSFGVMAYEMLTSKAPFEGVPVRLALQGRPLPAIQAPLEGFSTIPKPIAIIITACLSFTSSDRPTASVIEDCLSSN
jgi:hypothetical protein